MLPTDSYILIKIFHFPWHDDPLTILDQVWLSCIGNISVTADQSILFKAVRMNTKRLKRHTTIVVYVS